MRTEAVGNADLLKLVRGLPPLSVGETVSIKILGHQNGKYSIILNGQYLEAESNLPLQIGERIKVRIEALEPKVILVPLEEVDLEKEIMATLKGNLRLFRQEPDLLGRVFNQGLKIIRAAKQGVLRVYFSRDNLEKLIDKWESLMGKALDVREFAAELGLFHERNLARDKNVSENLKAILIRLNEELEGAKLPRMKEMEELSGWISATLSRIESCQVVNVLSQERGGLFFLPLPFLFGGEIRIGEFFGEAKKTKEGKESRIWFYIDLPVLGPIMVEMRFLSERLSVLVRCERRESKEFLEGKMASLKERLDNLGYRVATLGCRIESDLESIRRDLWQAVPAYNEGALRISV